jgi:hypothetical protein
VIGSAPSNRTPRFSAEARYSSAPLQHADGALDAEHMRSVLISALFLTLAAVVLLAYLAMAVAAHTALTSSPWDYLVE